MKGDPMRQDEGASPVSFKANVARLPQKGMPVVIEANAAQREALAAAHDLVSVECFRANLLVTSWKRNGVQVAGTVEADIIQACVLTLEPLESTIRENVEGLFLPEDSKLGRLGFHGGGEMLLDAEGPDSPETFFGDTIDVGALTEEFFGLAIDPYPRKPGASLAVARDDAPIGSPEGSLQEKLRSLTRKS
jgi:hypothetical protein